jgi:hypothetical protein
LAIRSALSRVNCVGSSGLAITASQMWRSWLAG